MIYPNYESGSIVNLVSIILDHYGVKGLYKPLKDIVLPKHKRLVFLVIDGMGLSFLEKHGKESFIYNSMKRHLTSVFPSTTSAALTALMTGVAPLQHGLTGWFMYFRELATAAIPLPFAPRFVADTFSNMKVDINEILNFKTIFKTLNCSMKLLAPKVSIDSAFSRYCYGDKAKQGFEKVEECFALIKEEIELRPDTEMIYAYIPHFDDMAHYKGINSQESVNFFKNIDKMFHDLTVQTQDTETLYIVTADHGLVDTTPKEILKITDFKDIHNCLILPLCGDPRSPSCYVRPAKLDYFRRAVDDQLSEYCERHTQQELFDMNIYGLGEVNPLIYDRIGDEILFMKSNYAMVEKVYHEEQKEIIGFHGGLSGEEMLVPLIIIK